MIVTYFGYPVFRAFGLIDPKTLNYLVFQSSDFERTRGRLFQKRVNKYTLHLISTFLSYQNNVW